METNVEDMILKVDQLFDDGEYAEGRNLLEEILEMEPDCGRAHNHVGWLHYYKLDNYKRAEYHYKLAIKFSPRYPAAWLNYAIFLAYLGRTDELKDLAERALKVQGINRAAIHNQLGQVHEMQGRYEEALSYYNEAYMKATNKTDYKLFLENFTRAKSKTSFMAKVRLLFATAKEREQAPRKG